MQIITTHKHTDFDALASVFAATLLYPGSIPVLPKSINPNVKAFISIHKDLFDACNTDDISLPSVTRLIVVDVNDWSRLDRLGSLKKRQNLEIFLWDHHARPGTIQPDWELREATGATVTLLIRQLKKEKKEVTPVQATLFLAGIYEDTGNLTFPSSTAEDAYAAAYMLEKKADLTVIANFLRPAYGEQQKNILFEMLQSTRKTKINGYRISINKINIQGHVENLAVVVHMYQEIVNVDAAFGIFTDKQRGSCMVIGRSQRDGLNIGAIMRSMGGGGHRQAGAAVLKAANPDAVGHWIMELIQGNQQTSVQISDLMSFPVEIISADTPMKKAAEILRQNGYTGLPVVTGNKVVGMISRRDFRKIKKESQLNAPVKAFMSNKVITILPGKSPMDAARLMIRHDIGRLPVVEEGKIVGIVTRSDAMRYFYDLLPD